MLSLFWGTFLSPKTTFLLVYYWYALLSQTLQQTQPAYLCDICFPRMLMISCSLWSYFSLHSYILLLTKAQAWGQSHSFHLTCHKLWVQDFPKFSDLSHFQHHHQGTPPIYFLLETLKFSFLDKRILSFIYFFIYLLFIWSQPPNRSLHKVILQGFYMGFFFAYICISIYIYIFWTLPCRIDATLRI